MAKDDQKDVKHARFHVSAALFEELGERLVSKPEIALAELIKNSYDADATFCTVEVTEEEIVVTDDGHGLTELEFLNNWMVVSSSNKAKRRASRKYKRTMAGSKGVGRFSARFLGTVLLVNTTARDPADGKLKTLTASFDWIEISKKADVSDIEIEYKVVPAGRGASTGMTLSIHSLRENISDLPVTKVRTDVLRLVKADGGLEQPEFGHEASGEVDPGFGVVFPEYVSEDAQLENLAESILDKYVARARVSVSVEGKVDFRIYWKDKPAPVEKLTFPLSRVSKPYTAKSFAAYDGEKDEWGVPVDLSPIDHLPLASALNSPVFVDLRFFPNRQGTFSGLPVNGKKAMTWVKENAGIAVVDNGFAMPAYADENSDWLAIEASKASNQRNWQSILTPSFYPMDAAAKRSPKLNPMLALPRLSQLIGRVHVATQKVPAGVEDDSWLHPNMDREQLRENGAYRLLWHLIRFTVEALAHHDRAFRLHDEEIQEEEAREQARSGLASAIAQISASSEINYEHKQSMLRQLREVEQQYTIAEGYDKGVQMSLELMSMMGVMAGFMTHEFDKTLESIHSIGSIVKKLSIKHPELADDAEIISRNEIALAQQAEYMRLYVGVSRNVKVVPFKAKAQLNVATRTLLALAEEHGIDIEIEVDRQLPGPAVPIAAYHGVAINLVSNAMKALVAKASSDDRKVKLYAFNDETKHTFVCADNGIGIPDYLQSRIWDPLFSTTEDTDDRNPLTSGLGLGLAVVKRVVDGVGGKIELLKKAPPGFVTAFKVVFPV
ncbi:sensor histidine kinase [Pseudomonas gingeri]|uniref:histidine kinase n=1 Tax=Pseudomonas gingeri TaxID=117681 RepID=A0A7Y8BII8_9PSED|nr:ATP-binding protein [Pseudomonas gingeri]NWB44862.1 ATP-binding protein [Pseudomonas gingeri]